MNSYSAIREMFYGRRGDGQLIQPNEEYHKEIDKIVTAMETLKEKLKDDKEGLELLEILCWASSAAESAAVEQHYREGFSFGFLMGMEIAGMR